MDKIIDIFAAPFSSTPNPEVTMKQVAIAYGLTALFIGVVVSK